MVKFKVALKDLLGKAYYRYNIGTTITNGTKGETGKIRCTVTNIFGNPVSDKEVTLYAQGTEVSTKTTDALGYVEWDVTYNDANLRLFKIDVHSIYAIVKNGGWKTYSPQINSYTTFYYNDDTRTAEFLYYRTNYTFSSTSAVTLHTGEIPSNYRPKTNVNLASYNQTIAGNVNTSGDILAHTTSTGTKTINLTGIWHY